MYRVIIKETGETAKARDIEYENEKYYGFVELYGVETRVEIEILNKYLPEQLTQEEILEIIEQAFTEVNPSGMKDMGKIMAAIKPKTKGRADGKLINELVKNNLQ